jgi:hypothetical protein
LVVGLALVAAGFVPLGFEAVHGERATAEISTDKQVAAWEIDARYWNCLETQARSLVRPGERVWLDTFDFVSQVTLIRIMGGWVDFTASAKPAQVYVTIRPATGKDGCLGSVVVALFGGPRGPGTVVRLGSGSSFAGSPNDLPVTPL